MNSGGACLDSLGGPVVWDTEKVSPDTSRKSLVTRVDLPDPNGAEMMKTIDILRVTRCAFG